MSEYAIYHNPRCSKSRATLSLLEARGITPQIVLYLEQSPTVAELTELVGKLGVAASQIIRSGEEQYKSAGLSVESSEDELLAAMVAYPKLRDRPVVVRGDRAVLGRPPENVLLLIND